MQYVQLSRSANVAKLREQYADDYAYVVVLEVPGLRNFYWLLLFRSRDSPADSKLVTRNKFTLFRTVEAAATANTIAVRVAATFSGLKLLKRSDLVARCTLVAEEVTRQYRGGGAVVDVTSIQYEHRASLRGCSEGD